MLVDLHIHTLTGARHDVRKEESQIKGLVTKAAEKGWLDIHYKNATIYIPWTQITIIRAVAQNQREDYAE